MNISRTYYVAAIDIAGMSKSTQVFGQIRDAKAVLTEWQNRGEVAGQSWDKPLVFATIADSDGVLDTYDFRA